MSLNPFRAWLRTWFYDVGCLNFLVSALLFSGLACLDLFFLGQDGTFWGMMYGLSIISVAAAITWQLIRLQATEWQSLIPGFKSRILIQSCGVYALFIAIGFGVTIVQFEPVVLYTLFVATLFANGLILMCQIKPSWFQLAFVVYVLHLSSQTIASLVPAWFLVLFLAVSFVLIIRNATQAKWQQSAVNVYRSGLGASSLSLPQFNLKWLNVFERFLFPANFFIGSTLSNLLILIPVICTALLCGKLIYGWDMPVLFVMLQVSIVLGSLIHWGRVQKPEAVEMLYSLPFHNGKANLRKVFASSQRKVAYIITLSMLWLVLLEVTFNDEFSLSVLLHVLMVTFATTILMLGLTSRAQCMWQYSLAMLPAIVIGAWSIFGYQFLIDTPEVIWPFVLNIIFLIIAELVFRYSQTKMWR